MSKNSLPISYNNLLYRMGHDFLCISYISLYPDYVKEWVKTSWTYSRNAGMIRCNLCLDPGLLPVETDRQEIISKLF